MNTTGNAAIKCGPSLLRIIGVPVSHVAEPQRPDSRRNRSRQRNWPGDRCFVGAARLSTLRLPTLTTAALAHVATEIGAADVRISRHRLDVADRDAVAAFPARVISEHGSVDVLVNNAGVALGGTFLEIAERDFEWLFEINFWGVVRMTRAFLPHLQKSEEAWLVNLSSLFGLIAPPGQTAYAASKFAVRGFSEALRRELEQAKPRIGVTVVHPGGVATSIAKNARLPDSLSAEETRNAGSFSTLTLRCRRKSPARSSFAASNGEKRAFWSAPMPNSRHLSSGSCR